MRRQIVKGQVEGVWGNWGKLQDMYTPPSRRAEQTEDRDRLALAPRFLTADRSHPYPPMD